MKSTNLLILTTLCFNICSTSKHETSDKLEEINRTKRQLLGIPIVFTYGGTYKFIVGFISPVHSVDYVKFVFAVNFQYQYIELTNITEVSQYFAFHTVSREHREAEWEGRKNERLTFYRAVEEMMNMRGYNGPECMKRAICEAAQYPVDKEALVGEVIHILLTPNYGRSTSEDTDEDWKNAMRDYISAQTAGEQMFHCLSIYKECPEGQGVLELISELQDD